MEKQTLHFYLIYIKSYLVCKIEAKCAVCAVVSINVSFTLHLVEMRDVTCFENVLDLLTFVVFFFFFVCLFVCLFLFFSYIEILLNFDLNDFFFC